MTTFVDDMMMKKPTGDGRVFTMCHLAADSLEELHQSAKEIGLKKRWFQDRPRFPHYDVTLSKRREAVSNGAILISLRQMIQWSKLKAKGVALWHGTQSNGKETLLPFIDKRTGYRGVFASCFFEVASLFSLLPSRHDSRVNFDTYQGRFVNTGRCLFSQPPNQYGYVYLVDGSFGFESTRYHDKTDKAECISCEAVTPIFCVKVSKKEVSQWWEFEQKPKIHITRPKGWKV